jgi:lycopene beta-cyclase
VTAVSAPEFDAIIAGGGLSGLSLAAHLAAGDWRDRAVLVVDDPEPARAPAASWGSWTTGAGLLDDLAARTYRRVRVYADGRSRVLPLGRYRYQLVRRPDLCRAVDALVSRCPGFSVRRGRVERIGSRDGLAEVVVDGEVLRAAWAFDSVTAVPPGRPVDARLAFTGWEIRCPRPVFDPDSPVLFDFRTPQAGRARFIYVLPDDPHGALVELAEFTGRGTPPSSGEAHIAALTAYLKGHGPYEVWRTESAVLPLRVCPPARRRGRVMPIGLVGGLLKASTGYAYQRIQRDSAAIAASLARHGHPFAVPRSRPRHRLLDAVLLEVLDRDPAQLERAFARLFLTNPADRVLRFLDEDSALPDEVRLAASLPPAPYLGAVPRAARSLAGAR